MKKVLNKISIPVIGLMTPMFVFAATDKTFQQIATELIIKTSNYVLTLLVALTVFVFLAGLMKYMFKGQESDEARSSGRKLMLWGIIGIFVMTSIWSLVGLLAGTIGQNQVGVPQFRTSGSGQNTLNDNSGLSGTAQNQSGTQSGTRTNTSVGSATNRVGQLWQNFQNNASNVWNRVRGNTANNN